MRRLKFPIEKNNELIFEKLPDNIDFMYKLNINIFNEIFTVLQSIKNNNELINLIKEKIDENKKNINNPVNMGKLKNMSIIQLFGFYCQFFNTEITKFKIKRIEEKDDF